MSRKTKNERDLTRSGESMDSPPSGSTRPATGNSWQPIETAPKDGTWILLWWPFWAKNRPTLGWFGFKGIQQWFCIDALEGDGDGPTHWMPLPDPPDPPVRKAVIARDADGLPVRFYPETRTK